MKKEERKRNNPINHRRVRRSDIANQYHTHPSFSDRLPWLEWSDEEHLMLLEDRRSVGTVLEIRDISTESQPESVIAALHEKITTLFSTVLPLEDENPWVLQFFSQDDLTLDPLCRRLASVIEKNGLGEDHFSQRYLTVMKRHLKLLCREEGLFQDPMSGLPFRGRTRRLRVVVYRRYTQATSKKSNQEQHRNHVVAELREVIDTLKERLRQAGISVRQLQGKHLYDWWVRWFNPDPELTEGDVDALLACYPYPLEEAQQGKQKRAKKPFGWSFSQNVLLGSVASTEDSWLFDGIHHKVMLFEDLQNPVDIGVISRERAFGGGKNKYALIDKFPPGTIYTIQVVFESKANVKRHLKKLEKAAIGKDLSIQEIINNIERAHYEIDENNNMLFRCVEAIYYRGKTKQSLRDNERQLKSLLSDSGLRVLDPSEELYPLDTYLRFLPFNFNYHFDKQHTFRSTYQYADDVVRLLPLYGRSRGDGVNPLFVFYNRGGEAFLFDHFNKDFKMANSHMAIVGTTGAGKSVTLNNLCMSLSAIHNPHIIALEVGGSFDLTARYFEEYGRSVCRLKFDRRQPLSINPYAEAYQALALIENEEARYLENQVSEEKKDLASESILLQHSDRLNKEVEHRKELASEKELESEEDRDILNEMVLATRVMITRGQSKEEEKLDLTDMTLIQRGLIHAMKRCRDSGVPQMLIQHVAESFELLSDEAKLEKNSDFQARLKQFSMRLQYYIQDTVRGRFVNQPSKPFEHYDFMQIDLGFMQNESYQDLLSVVCIAILSKILALAESNKSSGRPIVLLLDEVHVILKVDMIAVLLILISKVGRKLGLWLIPCTQNIHDFKGLESRKMLSMMETWLCLALDREEVSLVEQFKPLTEEMRSLVMDIRKYPGLYSEGVLLGKRFSGLFRNVPPRLALALAMTEQDERTLRNKIQREKNLTELEAVEYLAEQLEKSSTQRREDIDFYD